MWLREYTSVKFKQVQTNWYWSKYFHTNWYWSKYIQKYIAHYSIQYESIFFLMHEGKESNQKDQGSVKTNSQIFYTTCEWITNKQKKKERSKK